MNECMIDRHEETFGGRDRSLGAIKNRKHFGKEMGRIVFREYFPLNEPQFTYTGKMKEKNSLDY